MSTTDLILEKHADTALIRDLVAALDECATRFERCCVHSGSDKEFAASAVEKYRALTKQVKGRL